MKKKEAILTVPLSFHILQVEFVNKESPRVVVSNYFLKLKKEQIQWGKYVACDGRVMREINGLSMDLIKYLPEMANRIPFSSVRWNG